MSALRVRDELIFKLNDLDDTQIAALLEFIKVIQPVKSLENYSEATDPLLNSELQFSAAPDFAERSEDILAVPR